MVVKYKHTRVKYRESNESNQILTGLLMMIYLDAFYQIVDERLHDICIHSHEGGNFSHHT